MTPFRKKYHCVGLGGTFDHFHAGHAYFLQQASQLSEKLIIGVTTDALLATKVHREEIESYPDRYAAVQRYLTAQSIAHQLIPLADIAGPTLTDEQIEAVVLTENTKQGGEGINRLRADRGLSALPIEVVSLQSVDGKIVSSRAIRLGTMNRQGSRYRFCLNKDIDLNEQQRSAMREVAGEIVDSIPDTDTTRYVVGDSSLKRFFAQKSWYTQAIIDGKEQRQPYSPLVIPSNEIELTLINPAGSISAMMAKGLALAVKQKLKHIFIEGEEDVAAVVLQLILPLGSTIYYGQPGMGLVRWPVTEVAKERMALLLDSHFQTNPKLVE